MASKKKQKAVTNKLFEAMQFLSLAPANGKDEAQSYCTLAGGTAMSFNGIIALGTYVEDDIAAYPHIESLMLAAARSNEAYSITQLSADRLYFRSGDFQVYIPCCDGKRLPAANPDAAIAPVSDSLKAALKVVLPLTKEKGESVTEVSIQLDKGGALASNRAAILEAWHGCDLPFLVLPRSAAQTLVKISKPLKQFGFSEHTATFWFEDDSWMRTQLYISGYTELRSKLEVESNMREISPEFFEAVKKVEPFSEDGRVYCGNNNVASHHCEVAIQVRKGSDYVVEIEGGFHHRSYPLKELKLISKYCKQADESGAYTVFQGVGARGAIWHDIYDGVIPF